MKEELNTSKAERTRQFIIEKTAPVFNKKGYAGTSLTDITEATGLTKGSIYGNFANKDEVALAVFDYNYTRVNAIIKAEVGKATTYREKLLAYVRVYQNFSLDPFPRGGCPILNTAVEADDTHPALRKKAAEAVLQWKNGITRIIEQGITAGEFQQSTQAEQIAVTMIAMTEGAIMMAKLFGKRSYLTDVLSVTEKMIEDIV